MTKNFLYYKRIDSNYDFLNKFLMSKVRNKMYSKNDFYYRKINLKSSEKILENLKILYSNCKSNQKSNVLAIVSKLFSRKYLNKNRI